MVYCLFLYFLPAAPAHFFTCKMLQQGNSFQVQVNNGM